MQRVFPYRKSKGLPINQTFNDMFWEWFDGLPVDQKRPFWYYPEDAADIYFFNRIYRHTDNPL